MSYNTSIKRNAYPHSCKAQPRATNVYPPQNTHRASRVGGAHPKTPPGGPPPRSSATYTGGCERGRPIRGVHGCVYIPVPSAATRRRPESAIMCTCRQVDSQVQWPWQALHATRVDIHVQCSNRNSTPRRFRRRPSWAVLLSLHFAAAQIANRGLGITLGIATPKQYMISDSVDPTASI